jgi:hypothetical protein
MAAAVDDGSQRFEQRAAMDRLELDVAEVRRAAFAPAFPAKFRDQTQ